MIDERSALIIVDVQNDFCPGGPLAVPRADQVIPVLNDYIQHSIKHASLIVASRDWHPPSHCSFKDQGGIWPPHCIQDTPGAQFHPSLKLPGDALIVSKGTSLEEDAYSAFQGTELQQLLASRGIASVMVGGLATDYCVLETTLDSLRNGNRTYLLVDASRAVNVRDGEAAIARMVDAGATPITIRELQKPTERPAK